MPVKMRLFEFPEDDIYSLHAREDFFLNDIRDNLISFSRLRKPSISLGRLQNYNDLEREKAEKDRVDVTRRKTGGRFMYLDSGFLIVSFAFNDDVPPVKAYESVCGLITSALEDTTHEHFYLDYVNDIMHSSGKKIGGAAQSKNLLEGNYRHLVHAYVRYDTDSDSLFRYCRIDGESLEKYSTLMEPFITSVKDLSPHLTFDSFYESFRDSLVRRLVSYRNEEVVKSSLLNGHKSAVANWRNQYTDPGYISGKSDYPSRGHCDVIAGSGPNAVLKIPSLLGKVNYS
jgi:lipoate-protein ligase A